MKVALIEVHAAHAECLYTQLQLLKESGHKVTLIVPEGLKKQVSAFNHANTVFLDLANKWKQMQNLRAYVKKHAFDVVIFNTAQGRVKKFFYSLKPLNAKVYGTIHKLNKLKGSVGQQIISKHICGYFVLSETLKSNAELNYPNQKFEAYYPALFPEFNTTTLPKKPNEVWITVPGNIEFTRRDYQALFEQLKSQTIAPHIKFKFLGRSNHKAGSKAELDSWIKELNLDHQITYFEDFVENELFHAYLKQSDYILPLLHPSHQSIEDYLKYKISGSFNLAYAYQIPLIMHNEFKNMSEFKTHKTIFYNLNDLISLLNSLPPTGIKTTTPSQQFSIQKQAEAYNRFISSC